jgi:hypothetical protein
MTNVALVRGSATISEKKEMQRKSPQMSEKSAFHLSQDLSSNLFWDVAYSLGDVGCARCLAFLMSQAQGTISLTLSAPSHSLTVQSGLA